MVQDSCSIGIIGGGPAGVCCAHFLLKNGIVPTIIDFLPVMKTILPTGGGKCNLTNAEYDYRELVKHYPRGEKFLYSIFSRFSASDTLDLFDELGIETYIREDNRVFPVSNTSFEVREKFLNSIKKCKIIKEKALRIEPENGGIKVVTDMSSYRFDKVVISIGGKSDFGIIKRAGISIIEPKPSLVGLVSASDFTGLMGVALKNVYNYDTGLRGDILFTHFGISGPLVYKISSLKSRDNVPYLLRFDFAPDSGDLQTVLDKNPHKCIKNVLSDFVPHKVSEFILRLSDINPDIRCHNIDGKTRDLILDKIHQFRITVKSTKKDGETVTSGGVNLDKINPKTMESREISDIYFCGEVINVDGFCGGFNLQNCWSTGYVCANGIISDTKL